MTRTCLLTSLAALFAFAASPLAAQPRTGGGYPVDDGQVVVGL